MRITTLIYLVCMVTLGYYHSSAQGIITTIAGNGVTQYIGDGWPATSYSLASPAGVCADKQGNVYSCDNVEPRIRKIDKYDTLFTIAGTGTPGYTGDGGMAAFATFGSPACMVIDTAGNLFITDQYNKVIRKINRTTNIVTTVCGSGGGGFGGDGGPATAANLEQPEGVWVDKQGNIYVVDKANQRVRKVDALTGIINTIAGNGTNGYSGDGGLAVNTRLSFPRGVCTDDAGNVFIADYGNNRIRRIDNTTGIITTIAGTGAAGYTGDGGPATAATLVSPYGLYWSSQGRLYIADYGNNVVRAISADGTIRTVAGSGLYGFSGDGGPALSATFQGPKAVYVDDSEYLYIADSENSAIRKVTPSFNKATNITTPDILNVYPNPANNILTISCNIQLTDATAALYNMLGHEVYHTIINGYLSHINITSLPVGIYILQVRSGVSVSNKKIEIRR